MSTSAPPPAPLAPPDEEFWDRYNPHHEFPLSSIGSIAMHVGGLVLFILALWLLSKMAISDKTAPPMRTMIVAGEGDGGPSTGQGGGERGPENVDPIQQSIPKQVPQAELDKAIPDLKPFLPKVPSNQAGLRPEDLPNVKRYAGLDPDMQKKLLEGISGKKGKGPGDGSGNSGVDGSGSGTSGDATSSANRGVRWELNFKTADGNDYLSQLKAMKATLLIPQPTAWTTYKAYRLAESTLVGEDFDTAKLPGLHFIDDDGTSPARLVKAMGLSFSPPKFLAFFPKDVEEELAAKERAYRGRSEKDIFSTTFKILIRDGKWSVTVIDQQAVRK